MMMPKKKLQFYARQHGLKDPEAVVLSDADCVRVCQAIGVKTYTTKDCAAQLSGLVDCVYYDEGFRQQHANPNIDQDFLATRFLDYAADAVMKAYMQGRAKV